MRDGYPSELDNKTLLLKTINTEKNKQEEIKLILTWKLHLYWLDLMMLDAAMKTTRGKIQSSISPNCESYKLKQGLV